MEEERRRHAEEVHQLQMEHAKEVDRVQTTAAQQFAEREKQMSERLAESQADYDCIKDQSRKLFDSMHSDKDSKLQVNVLSIITLIKSIQQRSVGHTSHSHRAEHAQLRTDQLVTRLSLSRLHSSI